MSYQYPPGPPGPPPGSPPPAAPPPLGPGYGLPPMPPYPQAAGPAFGAPPTAMLVAVTTLLLLLGTILRGVSGFMDPGSSQKNVYWVGCLAMGIGLAAGAFAMFRVALKEADATPGVKVGALFVAALLILFGIAVTANPGAWGGLMF